MFLLSLDEIDRVKRAAGIKTLNDFADRTPVSERTWRKAIRTRYPTPTVLAALADLGARAECVLVKDDDAA